MIELIFVVLFSTVSVDRLEDEYWTCERLAQTGGLTINEMQYCSLITEKFKQERFRGQNEPFWDYYKKNKHHKLIPSGPRAGSEIWKIS